ncbi:GNAT family N-acetyltransferase [Vagococcus vulneris]|uniref:GNAT family N-acetyltransferase n=1 Tax=Vagococcus vulneris TaxID=1977869 RepID=A0A429ZYB2_9ENTE|nr:GNAT family N-acetyltransferase [Vagococcus vulneris]RST98938.1 GNAT family N-acetyltransferase [Vagococcus vulneris]
MNYQIGNRLELTQIMSLYDSVGWTAYTDDYGTLNRAIRHSLFVLTAWDKEQLIGLIRVVGDGETIIYIQDLLVRPSYHRQGIGQELLKRTLEEFKDVRQKVLLTVEGTKIRRFYESCGFVSCDQGQLVAFYREY